MGHRLLSVTPARGGRGPRGWSAEGNRLTGEVKQAAALDPCGVVGGTNDEKVVVHDQHTLGAVALLHPLQFAGWRVHQHDVGFAPCAEGQGGPGADRDGFDVVASLLLEQRDQHVEQATALGNGGGRQDQVLTAPGCAVAIAVAIGRARSG